MILPWNHLRHAHAQRTLYNETIEGTNNQRWRTLTDAANSISSGRGYFTYIFGNITGDQRYNQSIPTK